MGVVQVLIRVKELSFGKLDRHMDGGVYALHVMQAIHSLEVHMIQHLQPEQ